MALTDKQARSAKPSDKPYKLADTLSLYLLVKPNGFRIWYFKYRFEGKESGVSFGPYPKPHSPLSAKNAMPPGAY